MRLKRLSLLNFKNLSQTDIALSEGINCFVGDNGAGKTNVLDAIYYLSMSKSAFTMTDGQSVRHGEEFFFTEFLPMIEKEYRIKADKQHRAIAGLSMGGGGCTSYAQRHADMFGACYAMSAFLHMGAEGVDAQKVAEGDKTALLFDAAHRLSCVDYVKNADEARKQELRTVAWFVDCGDDDFLFDGNMDFYQAMRRAQIPCQLRVRDGGHTWEYWHSALYTALPWVSRVFTK